MKKSVLVLIVIALFAPASPAHAQESVSGHAAQAPVTPEPETRPQSQVSLLTTSGGETVRDIEAPPAAPGRIPFALEVGTQSFSEYQLTFTEGNADDTDWYHTFDVPRLWLWTGFRMGDAVGRVLLEGTRTSGPGSLIGVDGDSLVARFREAWAGYRFADMVELRAGLVPQLTTPALTDLWGMRAVAEIGLRSFELMQPADLGGTARLELPNELGSIQLGFYNGEGYRSREMNRGKTLEALAQLHPLAMVSGLKPLTFVAAYQNGSTGVGLVRNDRVVGALAWSEERFSIGSNASYLLGIEDRGDREGLLMEAWARAEPFSQFPLLLGVLVGRHVVDLQAQESWAATQLTAAAGARIAPPVRAFLAVDARFADERFTTLIPGYERVVVRAVIEGNFGGRFTGAF